MECAVDDFAVTHFGGARLGDKRLVKRLVLTADRMARRPGGSLPDKMQSPKDLKGLYRLANNPKVTHRNVLQCHFDHTRRAVLAHDGVVLIVHDADELDFTTKRSLREQTGLLGNGHSRGFLCHNSIAVTAAGEPLGLLNQVLHARRRRGKGDSRQVRRADPHRESRLWVRGRRAIGRFPGKKVIDVCDRGGDTFEFLDFEQANGYGCLVRSYINRVCLVGHAGDGPRAKLHDHLRSLPAAGRRPLDVPPQPATKRRPARPGRRTQVSVSWAAVTLRPPPPGQARGEHRQEPLKVWGVRVWEEHPPEGVDGLEWLLLSGEPVEALGQAWEKVDWYEQRWPTAEEYHKAQKTGCKVEGPQFTTAGALKPVIGVLSVVAWLLLRLRWEARQEEARQRRASELLPLEWVLLLSLWRCGAARPDWTAREFFLALARLGGHQNRKGDGLPGWQTIWKGWMKLQVAMEFRSLHDPPTCGQR